MGKVNIINNMKKTNILKYLSYQIFLFKKSIWFWIIFIISMLFNIAVFLLIYFLSEANKTGSIASLAIFKSFSIVFSIICLILFSTWSYGIINKSTRESNIDLLAFTNGMSRKAIYFSRFLIMFILINFLALIYAIVFSIIARSVNYYVGINNFLYFLSFILISWMIVVVLFPIFELTTYVIKNQRSKVKLHWFVFGIIYLLYWAVSIYTQIYSTVEDSGSSDKLNMEISRKEVVLYNPKLKNSNFKWIEIVNLRDKKTNKIVTENNLDEKYKEMLSKEKSKAEAMSAGNYFSFVDVLRTAQESIFEDKRVDIKFFLTGLKAKYQKVIADLSKQKDKPFIEQAPKFELTYSSTDDKKTKVTNKGTFILKDPRFITNFLRSREEKLNYLEIVFANNKVKELLNEPITKESEIDLNKLIFNKIDEIVKKGNTEPIKESDKEKEKNKLTDLEWKLLKTYPKIVADYIYANLNLKKKYKLDDSKNYLYYFAINKDEILNNKHVYLLKEEQGYYYQISYTIVALIAIVGSLWAYHLYRKRDIV